MTSQLEKMIENIFKKVYKNKLNKLNTHSKKIKKIRAKKKYKKKQALHNQFIYADQLLQHNQKKLGLRPIRLYNKNRQMVLRKMNGPQVYRIWNNTHFPSRSQLDPATYIDFRNIYRNLIELDWIGRQQQQYNQYQNT